MRPEGLAPMMERYAHSGARRPQPKSTIVICRIAPELGPTKAQTQQTEACLQAPDRAYKRLSYILTIELYSVVTCS